jgi:hypothetical protein
MARSTSGKARAACGSRNGGAHEENGVLRQRVRGASASSGSSSSVPAAARGGARPATPAARRGARTAAGRRRRAARRGGAPPPPPPATPRRRWARAASWRLWLARVQWFWRAAAGTAQEETRGECEVGGAAAVWVWLGARACKSQRAQRTRAPELLTHMLQRTEHVCSMTLAR